MRKILIVTHDMSLLQKLRKLLNNASYEIYSAGNAPVAIKLFRQENIDLIITDYKLPKVNGFDLMKMIRNICNKVPFIILLPDRKHLHYSSNFDLGVCYFLEKPINHKLLKMFISDIFD